MDNLFEFFASIEGLASLPASAGDTLPLLLADGRGGATGSVSLPLFAIEGISFGLDKPIDSGATSAAVVSLLQQGHDTLIQAAAQICAYDDDDDQRAISVVYFVSNLLTYVQDGSGIGDRWTGAVATWKRKYGDCEDGAFLIHALLLAAGVDPGRVRTLCGRALSTDLAEIGHAWVIYRRLTDEEWIPLEWTKQPSPYDVTAAQVKRQLDVQDVYTRISHVLTATSFSSVDSSGYYAQLAVNRASGAVSLPLFQVSGATGNHAEGEIELFRDFSGELTLSVEGRGGARGAVALPLFGVSGTASQANTATGEVALPLFSVDGRGGANGECALPLFDVFGRCGNAARGSVTLPLFRINAAADHDNLANGKVTLPLFVVLGHAVQDNRARGEVVLPLLGIRGRGAQGPSARGEVSLPLFQVAGTAHQESVARGEILLPLFEVRGHAVQGVPGFSAVLSHDPSRWL
jgi:hypothetical protein